MIQEALSIKGYIWLYSRPASSLPAAEGEWTLEYETPNLVTSAGKILVARLLAEESGQDTGLTHCEVGTDDTAPDVADTALGASHVRAAITRVIAAGAIRQFRTFFPAASISIDVAEVGLFGGPEADATIGSGELFNHALLPFSNAASTKDLTIVVQTTIS